MKGSPFYPKGLSLNIFCITIIFLHHRIELALLMTKPDTLCIQDLPKSRYRPIFTERASVLTELIIIKQIKIKVLILICFIIIYSVNSSIISAGTRINYFLHHPHIVAPSDRARSPDDKTGHIVYLGPPKISLKADLN